MGEREPRPGPQPCPCLGASKSLSADRAKVGCQSCWERDVEEGLMPIDLVAYAYVSPEGSTPKCEFRSVSSGIRAYLEGHIDSLKKGADRESSGPALFRADAARSRFTDLQGGTKEVFLKSAQDLTDRLHTAMDRRAKRGFLVMVRRSLGGEVVEAAALKLDVQDKDGAVASEAGPEPTLEEVRNLLDLPGTLQKGAVYPDARPSSDVVVGERAMADTAQYFLRALEVQQVAAVRSATGSFLGAVGSVATEKVEKVAEELDKYKGPVKPTDFLKEHAGLLTEEEGRTVLEHLEDQIRPVRVINPAARPPRESVVADGITIKGSVEDMRKVRWVPKDGRWQIQIDVSQEPRRRFE